MSESPYRVIDRRVVSYNCDYTLKTPNESMPFAPKPKPCGHSDCGVSTGIHDGLTFGRGELDFNGYWEHPCEACARAFDADCVVERQRIIADVAKRLPSISAQEILAHVREQHEYLFIEGWPFKLEEDRP